VFHNAERQLGAVVVVSDNTVGPLTIELKKCGSLEGRLLDEQRRPKDAQVIYAQIVEDAKEPDVVPMMSATTNQDGHFRIEGLIPAKTYKLSLQTHLQNVPALIPFSPKEITVQPGEAKDLGDIVRVPKAYLGVGFSAETACIVKFAAPDSPAAHLGLRSKDTIIKVDQQQVTVANDVRGVISKKKPGDKVQLEVLRGEQTLRFEVTLGQDPSQ
jgi:S1-C subfamily serine protease